MSDLLESAPQLRGTFHLDKNLLLELIRAYLSLLSLSDLNIPHFLPTFKRETIRNVFDKIMIYSFKFGQANKKLNFYLVVTIFFRYLTLSLLSQ